jgi:hypothetical protein
MAQVNLAMEALHAKAAPLAQEATNPGGASE